MHRRIIAALGLTALGGGCFSADPPSLVSNHAAQKIPAIKHAAEVRDQKACKQLVHDLNSDDPAVRFYAIEGLERLTGETFGYLYYQDRQQRRGSVMKWHQWLEDNHR